MTGLGARSSARADRAALTWGGIGSLLLGVLGIVAATSVIGAGGEDAVAYVVVNGGLVVLGVGLLITAWRRRAQGGDRT